MLVEVVLILTLTTTTLTISIELEDALSVIDEIEATQCIHLHLEQQESEETNWNQVYKHPNTFYHFSDILNNNAINITKYSKPEFLWSISTYAVGYPPLNLGHTKQPFHSQLIRSTNHVICAVVIIPKGRHGRVSNLFYYPGSEPFD